VRLEELLIAIINSLRKLKIEFIFSGAIAANVYRTLPRATMDIDIAIPFDIKILNKIKKIFQDYEVEDWDLLKERLAARNEHPDVIVPEILKLKHASGFEIDFFPLYSEYLSRKKTAKISNTEFDVIGPEDLILLKSLFNRYKDRDDIVNILENNALQLDLNYLIQELQKIGRDEIVNLIKTIRKKEFE